jgi:gamma-glutamyl hercynylcysteine S-oxide synthase
MAIIPDEYEDISQVEVKLKPFLGIRPGLYLTALYTMGALLLLFLIFFLPGIKKDGTVYIFESTPPDAAIYVDEYYAGSTPAKVFVPRGPHSLRIDRPFFTPEETSVKTGGRLFGSLFAPRKQDIVVGLELGQPEEFLASRLREISQWALVNQFGPSYQAPPLISLTVSDYYDAGAHDDTTVDRFLVAVLSSLNGEVFLADYIRALFLRESHGHAPGPDTFVRVARRVLGLASDYPSLALLLPALLRTEVTQAYTESDWFSDLVDSYRKLLSSYSVPSSTAIQDERIIAGMPFVRVPASEYAMGMPVGNESGAELPHPVRTQELYMLKGEITREWYGRFVAANPDWGPDRTDDLVAKNLVDKSYLSDWDDALISDLPVAYVSFNAAQAFARWFDESLPPAWQSFSARLPVEAEWEWAARLYDGASTAGRDIRSDGPLPITGEAGVENLMGSLWEWCGTWFHPADYFAKPWDPSVSVPGGGFDLGAEAVVRGGSWANTENDQVEVVSRGSQPPQWCTPFTGFRIVLVRE